MAVNIIVFQDTFVIKKLNREEALLNNVTRIEAKSGNHDMFMQLDVNTMKHRVSLGERFRMALAWTPSSNGTNDTILECEFRNITTLEKIKESLAECYDYFMCGKLYKISEEKENSDETSREIHASFDGLLMVLKGNPSCLPQLKLDQKLYLLVKNLGNSVIIDECFKP